MVELPSTSRADLSITQATDEDVPVIQSMVDAAYTKYIDRIGKRPAPMGEDYHQGIHTHTVLVLRERAKNKVVGAIVLELDPSSDSVKIDNLVVHPAAQGYGYGRVLMNCAEDLARSQGYQALTLYTNVKMYGNLGVYMSGWASTRLKGSMKMALTEFIFARISTKITPFRMGL